MFDNNIVITRLAPSPTGNLHLGNIWSFMLCWLAARSSKGKVFLRIDDIDRLRSRQKLAEHIIDDLLWLGFDWDKSPGFADGIYRQSAKLDLYNNVVASLRGKGLVYPCFCTRKELRMLASAPHFGELEKERACKCSHMAESEANCLMAQKKQYSLRLRSPEKAVSFTDAVYGEQTFPANDEFALIRSDGIPSYQLATVVDDSALGVNLVMRGNDLLSSTPRQIAILDYLNLPIPQYAHLPLLLDGSGERLAKRHASFSVAQMRTNGIMPEKIFGLLAWLGGIRPEPEPVSLIDLVPDFGINLIRPQDIVFENMDKMLSG